MAKYKPVQNQVDPTAPDDADEEDGRDVWDKALDWAPTIGMFAGATAGGRWGAKQGAKLYKKYESLENKSRKLRAKGSNPNVGLTTKERMDLHKAEEDAKHVSGEWGSNFAGRALIKAPGGAIAGNLAGGAVRDTFQSKKRKMRAGDE